MLVAGHFCGCRRGDERWGGHFGLSKRGAGARRSGSEARGVLVRAGEVRIRSVGQPGRPRRVKNMARGAASSTWRATIFGEMGATALGGPPSATKEGWHVLVERSLRVEMLRRGILRVLVPRFAGLFAAVPLSHGARGGLAALVARSGVGDWCEWGWAGFQLADQAEQAVEDGQGMGRAAGDVQVHRARRWRRRRAPRGGPGRGRRRWRRRPRR